MEQKNTKSNNNNPLLNVKFAYRIFQYVPAFILTASSSSLERTTPVMMQHQVFALTTSSWRSALSDYLAAVGPLQKWNESEEGALTDLLSCLFGDDGEHFTKKFWLLPHNYWLVASCCFAGGNVCITANSVLDFILQVQNEYQQVPVIKDVTFDYHYDPELVGKNLAKLVHVCKFVERLSLYWCAKVTGDVLETIAKSQLSSTLRVLDLSGCSSLASADIGAISKCAVLEELRFDQAFRTADPRKVAKHLRRICKLPNLRKLNLVSCKVNNSALVAIGKIKTLQVLDLTLNDEITDRGLKQLIELQELEELTLNYLNRVTDEGMQEISKLSKLKVLSMRDCEVGDEGLRHLENLQHLDLDKFVWVGSNVTKEGLAEFERKIRANQKRDLLNE